MTDPIFEITKAAAFDAAHYIEQGPADHRYRRLHGHSFRVEASVRGPAQPAGWVADLDQLDKALKAVAEDLDHAIALANDTSERQPGAATWSPPGWWMWWTPWMRHWRPCAAGVRHGRRSRSWRGMRFEDPCCRR